MLCPECKHATRVLQSRVKTSGVWRRRECTQCGIRFSTTEELRVATAERKKVALQLLDAVEKALT